MQNGAARLSADHPNQLIALLLHMDALGTTDSEFANGLMRQLANIGSKGPDVDEQGLNFMLSIVIGTKPRDPIEAMLAAQMAAVHDATMTFARRLNHVDDISQTESAGRTFNKLARTYAAQVTALKHYRYGGEQRVTVQHVNVNAGGQAIVGTVAPRGGQHKEMETQPDAKQIANAPVASMRGEVEKKRVALPVASCPRP